MIGIDWGTSSFRAYRMDDDGLLLDQREAPRGILHIEGGRFAEELLAQVGDWLAAGETRVLLSGMIGSRQGWVEAPYLPCPAGEAELAAALVAVPFVHANPALRVLVVPGLSHSDAGGTPEVMRGEETQIAGRLEMLDGEQVVCLPGSHSKWVRTADRRIEGFTTYLTGEMFAALRSATILGRMMRDGPDDEAAFDRGVARTAGPGHLLHQLFGVRTLGLFGRLAEGESASYLSGLLIGHEVQAENPAGREVHLIGSPSLCALYARAIDACGGHALVHGGLAAKRGLSTIARSAAWT